MPRMRLRTAMLVVAVLAVILGVGVGLWRRARRFQTLALQYGREANRLENTWANSGSMSPGDAAVLMERVHWNDAVAAGYRFAAARPWVPFNPEPMRVTCECGFHMARRAGTAK
jgi:hypothetical protein